MYGNLFDVCLGFEFIIIQMWMIGMESSLVVENSIFFLNFVKIIKRMWDILAHSI